MNATLTVEEAGRDFSALLEDVEKFHREAVITRGGRPVAKVVPFAASGMADDVALEKYRRFHERWAAETTGEDREAFARDIESARQVVNQAIPNRWE